MCTTGHVIADSCSVHLPCNNFRTNRSERQASSLQVSVYMQLGLLTAAKPWWRMLSSVMVVSLQSRP